MKVGLFDRAIVPDGVSLSPAAKGLQLRWVELSPGAVRKAVDGVEVRDPLRKGRWRKASGLGAAERDSTEAPSRDARGPTMPAGLLLVQ